MKKAVWVLDRDWGEDHDVSIFPSKDQAVEALYNYVSDIWSDVIDDEGIPEDPNEAIARYFEINDEENYYVWKTTLDFSDIPDVSEGEVILTSEECATIIALVESVSPEDEVIQDRLGTENEATIDLLFGSIHSKLKD